MARAGLVPGGSQRNRTAADAYTDVAPGVDPCGRSSPAMRRPRAACSLPCHRRSGDGRLGDRRDRRRAGRPHHARLSPVRRQSGSGSVPTRRHQAPGASPTISPMRATMRSLRWCSSVRASSAASSAGRPMVVGDEASRSRRACAPDAGRRARPSASGSHRCRAGTPRGRARRAGAASRSPTVRRCRARRRSPACRQARRRGPVHRSR